MSDIILIVTYLKTELHNNFFLISDMEKVFCNVDEKHKTNIVQSFQAVVSSVRTKYLNCNPDMYNWWILQFKAFTFETENVLAELWNVIVSGI